MNDKELEKKLKDSAKKIELDDFSIHWDAIKDKLDAEAEDVAPTVSAKSAVIATGGLEKQIRNKHTSLFVILACFFFVGIILSIVLPLKLKGSDKKYFIEEELTWRQISEEGFYNSLSELNIDFLAFNFEMESFELAVAEDGEIKGGKCNIFDEYTLCDGYLFIYDQFVTLSKYDYEEYSNSIVNTTNTVYYSEKLTADGLYKIDSIILTSSTNFRLELTFYDGNNFLLFVDKYFN